MFKHILVPTDGSALSENAIRRAVSFAKETQAEITAFYANPDLAAMGYYGEGALALLKADEDDEAYAEAYANKVLAFVENLCREAGVVCHTMTLTHACEASEPSSFTVPSAGMISMYPDTYRAGRPTARKQATPRCAKSWHTPALAWSSSGRVVETDVAP